MFEVLRQEKLYAKLSKYDFSLILFLAMECQLIQEKVSAVGDWPIPQNVFGIRRFLGLAGYYHGFVDGFSKIAGSLPRTWRES